MGKSSWDDKKRLLLWTREIDALFPNLEPYETKIFTSLDVPWLRPTQMKVLLSTKKDKLWIASFVLEYHPECWSLIDSTNSGVSATFQRKGIATSLMWQKKKIAKDVGVRGLIATVNNLNKAEIGLLTKTHWKRLMDYGEFSLWSTFPE